MRSVLVTAGGALPDPGWPLKADVSCSLVQGGNDLLGGGTWPPDGGAIPLAKVTTDFLGAARTPPFSRGAHEQDGAGCTNP